MGKRHMNDADGLDMRKRRRVVVHEPATSEDITTSRQLRQLLTFTQDLRQARHGLQSFKLFLNLWASEPDRIPQHLDLLKQYLDAVKPYNDGEDGEDGEDAVYLSDIMDTWSFAAESHNDDIMAGAAVVLSNLLRIISDNLDLVPHGLGICNTLLNERYHRLLSKNLSSDKNKSFIISPTLRLVREIVSFDGGVVAKRLFRARNSTLASLARNLEIKHLGEGFEDPTKSSVRTNAVRFFLACLRHLPPDAKKELLMEKHVVSHLTFLIQSDPPYLLREIISGLRQHVFSDDKVPRDIKFRAFNTKTLVRLLGLYSYKGDANDSDEEQPISDAVHEFLTFLTTDSTAGFLYNARGLYPKGMEEQLGARGKAASGLDSSFWLDKYKDEVPVFNFVLAEFIQKLRPWSSMKQTELLVAIFHAAPELISNYFVTNKAFTFEPKLSMTWMGYAAFLFNTILVPLPAYFGAKGGYSRLPPPTSVLLDNIMPLPINQKALNKCLAQDASLASFFATRLLVVAIEKLKQALEMHRESSSSPLWADAERRLINEFCQRIPDMKDVMRAYKVIPEENVLHREAASRILLLYYEIIPQAALVLNLDVSQSVASSLKRLASGPEDRALCQMELENLISIASHSPGMRWFTKSEGLPASPFTALLQLWVDSDDDVSQTRLRDVLEFVAAENQLVLPKPRLTPLLASLNGVQVGSPTWSFLDNCVARCSSSTIKYHEMLQALAGELSSGGDVDSFAISLLIVTMLDQLPFAVKAGSKEDLQSLAEFLWSYLTNSLSHEHAPLLELVWKKMASALPSDGRQGRASLGQAESRADTVDDDGRHSPAPQRQPRTGAQTDILQSLSDEELQEALYLPPLNADDTLALTKWSSKAADDLVEDGHAGKLARLLLSPHTSIRKEALTNILKMASKIKESTYEEKDQIWLLLFELAESSRPLIDDGPVPTFFAAFAVHALEVLRNPLHPLYAKVNRYLTKGPMWAPDRVPFAHDMLHGEPSEDDRYYQEISWFLSYVLDGLSTVSDMTTYHNRRLFEKILVLGGNPNLRVGLRTKILRIVFRATTIEGGSGTLATRFGIFSWLEAREAMAAGVEGTETETCGALIRKVWQTCKQSRISEWSTDGVNRLVERQTVGQ